jgi:hypothetical protein
MKNEIWSQLYQDSAQLSKPAQARKLIPTDLQGELITTIRQVLNEFISRGNLHLGMKTYINHELRNDLSQKMMDNPPANYPDLKSWASAIFGKDKFGIVLNSLEAYSNDFAALAARLVKPLLEKAGLPLEGLSFLFFMGDYGFTPFGVHKESVGEEGFLFHLGPGTKQFYSWDDPEYNAIAHNTQVFHDFDEMLPKATCHELLPGDAMFVPHQVYHIANTSEFSISFVMDYINPPADRFENELAKLVSEENLTVQDSFLPPLHLNSPASEWSQMLNFQSIQEKAATAFRRKMLGYISNGGIQRPSLQVNKSLPNGAFSIAGQPIFPIQTDEQSADKMLIFARGHRIEVNQHPELAAIITGLNSGKSVSFEMLKNQLTPAWQLSEIFALIDKLSRIEAVSLIPDNSTQEEL